MYCRDDAGPGSGRAVEGFCRPYATRIPGTPLVMRVAPGRFTLAWRNAAGASGTAEVFVPGHVVARGISVTVSDGTWRLDTDANLLVHAPGTGRAVHEITISWPPASAPRRPVARSSR